MHTQQPLESLRAVVACGPPYTEDFLATLRGDARAAAHALYERCLRREARNAQLAARAQRMMCFEEEARANAWSARA